MGVPFDAPHVVARLAPFVDIVSSDKQQISKEVSWGGQDRIDVDQGSAGACACLGLGLFNT